MQKLDLKRELKELYQPSAKTPQIITVPKMEFLMIEGEIEAGMEPGSSPSFAAATESLYGAAYAIKLASKKRVVNPIDYGVMTLEGIWWIENGRFDIRRKDNWKWVLMIMQPGHVDSELFEEALVGLRRRRGEDAAAGVRLESFEEGLCVQIMHVGPYSTEPETVDRMRSFADAQGFRFCDRHHEIYVGDPRRSDPAKLRTVLRHPIRWVS